MDTKLKKFNKGIFLKTIAFLLCICSVVNFMVQGVDIAYEVEEEEISGSAWEDAFYRIFANSPTTETKTFRHHFGGFADAVAEMLGKYGDGSKEYYEQWKNSITQSNEAYYKTAKKNLISHVIADELHLYLALVEAGVVVPLGELTTSEYKGGGYDIYIDEVYGVNYQEICNQGANVVVSFPTDEDLKKKAQELGADGVFELNFYYQILDIDDYSDTERIVESYKPGIYAFKVDDEALKNALEQSGMFVADSFASAANFEAEYKKCQTRINRDYAAGRYFIRDASGRVYTNVKGLDANSTQKEVEDKFSSLDFHCYQDVYGDIFLPDGQWFTQANFMSIRRAFDDIDYDYISATTAVHTTRYTGATASDAEATVTQPSTAPVNAFDATPFMDNSGESWYSVLGVDMDVTGDLMTKSEQEIAKAEDILESIAYILGVMGTIFLLCFIFLILRTGRRRGSKEAYLLKTDRMFVDLRIAIDCLAGFGIVMLFVAAVDEFGFEAAHRALLRRIIGLLAAAFTVVLLDLVLFIARKIKAKEFFKNLSLIWLIRKARELYKNKLSLVVSEKLLYSKDFNKGTIIRLAIFAAVNLIVGFFAVLEAYNNDTFFITVLLGIFDSVVAVWVVRLIGGIRKIFSALDEIKKGNYDVTISLYALPKALHESADKVMSLRDGLKVAVDEAVKQEQTKTELITNVSHDLKTPLTSIINYVELLKKCNINDEDAREYLDVLGEKSGRLKKLIEDLVEASKASTGNLKVEFVQVSLNEMVSQLLGEHADELEKRKLSVVAEFSEKDLTVKADGKLLYRVMENLIVNVEKYSLYGTRVYVAVKEEKGYGTVSFKNISEQPLNITAEQLKERFVRGDESRSTEGNGLGLSIAQSLCDVQGGELEIVINGDLFIAKVKLKK